jgi:lipoate---protein ligase
MIGRLHLCKASRPARLPLATRRWHTTSWLNQSLVRPVQSYISHSRDPYLNLAAEQYFLQKSAPESTLLFLYVNRPCIVLGRNQNPWLEANLALLDSKTSNTKIDLIRRRSGGGTVFHDEGNVNWSIICPAANFTRDKHAEMVVRALRSCGVSRARVNERHDIVLDQGGRRTESDPDDMHLTPCTVSELAGPRPLKVSGSAYKLTKGRALHHGTCLLSSPNLRKISEYLRSPARPYIKARGVESVSSPVSNIGLESELFIKAVREQFGKMYKFNEAAEDHFVDGKRLLDISAIASEYEELQVLISASIRVS